MDAGKMENSPSLSFIKMAWLPIHNIWLRRIFLFALLVLWSLGFEIAHEKIPTTSR